LNYACLFFDFGGVIEVSLFAEQLENGGQRPAIPFTNRNRGAQPAILDSYDVTEDDDDDADYQESEEDDLTRHLKRLKAYKEQKKEEQKPVDATAEQTRTKRTINPLYIGVPVAGACVLLAIIIFAIYILRRHNQYLEEQHRRKTATAKQLIYSPPKVQHKNPTISSIGHPGCPANCMYAESDRSSNGSETRLLMKV
jgi:hypothetical protein